MKNYIDIKEAMKLSKKSRRTIYRFIDKYRKISPIMTYDTIDNDNVISKNEYVIKRGTDNKLFINKEYFIKEFDFDYDMTYDMTADNVTQGIGQKAEMSHGLSYDIKQITDILKDSFDKQESTLKDTIELLKNNLEKQDQELKAKNEQLAEKDQIISDINENSRADKQIIYGLQKQISGQTAIIEKYSERVKALEKPKKRNKNLFQRIFTRS